MLIALFTVAASVPSLGLLSIQAVHFPRLAGLFLVGAAIRPWFDRIAFTWPRVAGSAVALFVLLLSPITATIGCATFGAYVLFGTGVLGGRTVLAKINNNPDISYGLYLYGWPVEKTIMWCVPGLGLFVTGVATLVVSAAAGYICWKIVEEPALRAAHRYRSRRAAPIALAV